MMMQAPETNQTAAGKLEGLAPQPNPGGKADPYARYKRLEPKDFNWFSAMVYVLMRFAISTTLGLRFYSVISGRQHIPREGSFIISANHRSFADIPLIARIFGARPISFLAKLELYATPLSALFFHTVRSIALDRQKVDKASIRSAKNALETPPWLLGIFPEGTRVDKTGTGQMGPAKRGVAMIAKMTGKPVLPIGIHYVSHGSWFRTAVIRIGEPLPPPTSETMDTFLTTLEARLGKLSKPS